MFDRYNIITQREIAAGLAQTAAYVDTFTVDHEHRPAARGKNRVTMRTRPEHVPNTPKTTKGLAAVTANPSCFLVAGVGFEPTTFGL